MIQVRGYEEIPFDGEQLFNKLLPKANSLWKRLALDDPLALLTEISDF